MPELQFLIIADFHKKYSEWEKSVQKDLCDCLHILGMLL